MFLMRMPPHAQAESSEDPYKRQYSAARGGARQRATTGAPPVEPQMQQPQQRRRRRQPVQPQRQHDYTGSEPNKYVCGCGRSFGKAAWLGNHSKACKLSSPRVAPAAAPMVEQLGSAALQDGATATAATAGEVSAGSPSLGAIVALHREVSPRSSPGASQAGAHGAWSGSPSAAAAAAAWQGSGRGSPVSVAASPPSARWSSTASRSW